MPSSPPATSRPRGTVATLLRLVPFVRPAIPRIGLGGAAALLAGVVALVIPVVLQGLVDGPLAQRPRDRVVEHDAAVGAGREGGRRRDRAGEQDQERAAALAALARLAAPQALPALSLLVRLVAFVQSQSQGPLFLSFWC